MELALPPNRVLDRPLTADEFLQLPDRDDDRREELFDGEVLVNPAPSKLHQLAIGNLIGVLFDHLPDDLRVLPGPGWVLDRHNVFEPDLIVLRRDLLEGQHLEQVPSLAVEVLSPSNRRHDLVRRRAAYERVGLPACWIVDPLADGGPTLLALELVDGAYVERSSANRHQPVTIERPFPVTVDPSRLLD